MSQDRNAAIDRKTLVTAHQRFMGAGYDGNQWISFIEGPLNGPNNYVPNNSVYVNATEAVAKRVTLIATSPHYETLIKAWLIRHGFNWSCHDDK
jgi:hypothetical protein